jgi:hypothetical protein
MGLVLAGNSYAQSWDELREMINSEDVIVRTKGWKKLKNMNPFPKEAIKWFVEGLESSDEQTRYSNVRVISQLGPKAKDLVPSLLTIFSDREKNPFARIEVPKTLGAIGTASDQVLPELTRIVSDTQEETLIRVNAIRSLKEIGSNAQPANPALKKLAEDDSIKVLQVASWEALAVINPEDKQWIPKLIETAEGKHGRNIGLHSLLSPYSTSYHPVHNALVALLHLNHKKILHDLLKKLIQSGEAEKEVEALGVIWKLDPSMQKKFIPDYHRIIKRIPKNKFEKDIKGAVVVELLRAERDPEKLKSMLEKIQAEDPDPKFRKKLGAILENIKRYSKLRKK